jgi:hypothetical protein
MAYSFIIVSAKISNAKIQMSNGGWEPIEHKIGRIPQFDIWALTLGFQCPGAASAILAAMPFYKLVPTTLGAFKAAG